jgi:hypothetical protein
MSGRRAGGSLLARAANAMPGESSFIRLQFPPSADGGPRYGYGRPPHPRLSELLQRADREYEEILSEFKAYGDDLQAITLDRAGPSEPFWRNGLLFGLDGVSLYGFTRKRAPRRYLEIGSGHSTLFVDRARRDGDINVEITSIDPHPRREIDAVCDRILRQPLELADLAIFDELQSGDIVFMDGTHHVFMNSDVTVFFLDVLPELPPGVLVGIHDIHLPDDYRPEHAGRHYSEQYLLASYLLGEPSWMRPILPCWYVTQHPQLRSLARSLIPQPYLEASPRAQGVIFWLQTEPREQNR